MESDPESRLCNSQHRSSQVLNAREKGAAGVLLVSGEKWDVADNLDKPSRSEAGSGIPVLQVKRSVADAIVRGSSGTIAGLEEKPRGKDRGRIHRRLNRYPLKLKW
ncbi:MAG: PA domain-containing protein [Bacteroidales bacterium]